MGTRADFYVGRGDTAEWLGSIAWDGYPAGLPLRLLTSPSEEDYRRDISDFLDEREDATRVENGWPWPWKDSRTTDYAYAFHENNVWACPFGYYWYDAADDDPNVDDEGEPTITEKTAVFPDMTAVQNVTLGGRSGLIVLP